MNKLVLHGRFPIIWREKILASQLSGKHFTSCSFYKWVLRRSTRTLIWFDNLRLRFPQDGVQWSPFWPWRWGHCWPFCSGPRLRLLQRRDLYAPQPLDEVCNCRRNRNMLGFLKSTPTLGLELINHPSLAISYVLTNQALSCILPPQINGFAPVWEFLMWTVRWFLYLKTFPHVVQWSSFLPLCILMWNDNSLLAVKHFPHFLQRYGFLQVWASKIWAVKSLHRLQFSPHFLQTYGFLLAWILTCVVNVAM